MDLKSEIDKLNDKFLELEAECDKYRKQLESIEESEQDAEEEKSQINIRNNDLTNQLTKVSLYFLGLSHFDCLLF